MAKYLDKSGVTYLWNKIKGLFTDQSLNTKNKTYAGAINEINTKVGNLTGAFLWKGKFDTLPAVTNYEAGNVVGVGKKEYVLTVTGGTKAWEEFGDEGSYLLKTTAEETYLKKAAGKVKTYNLADNAVTSTKLATGARKPIVLTTSTTEVDEETYHKLLSDDVDVVLKTDSGNICTFTWKYEGDTSWDFYFTCLSCEANDLEGTFLYGWSVNIEKSAPHKVTIVSLSKDSLSTILASGGFIDKSTLLPPVLQEIDLTGTDADRKAKLDQFETDWKALTGADDLNGARFVGSTYDYTGVFTYDSLRGFGYFAYAATGESGTGSLQLIQLDASTGSLTITPLFSHLEAVTIYTDNTPEHMQANLDNIAAYEANLQALGVNTDNNHIIPIKFDEIMDDMSFPFGGFITTYGGYEGFVTSTLAEQYKPRHIRISQGGGEEGKVYLDELALEKQLDNYTSKALNAKSLEAVTIYTDNTPEHMQANLDNIAAYEANLQALGVNTDNNHIIPIKFDEIMDDMSFPFGGFITTYGGYEGFVTSTLAEQYKPRHIRISQGGGEEGKVYLDELALEKQLDNYTSKALNAKSLEAVTIKTGNTPDDKAANVAAINAYVDNLKALGVDVTKGFMIPVKTDNGNGFILFNGTKGEGYVKTNNDCYGISIAADYGCSPINLMSTSTSYGTLETTSHRVLPAINEVNALAKSKQDALTSGTNIKTINGQSLLGSGDIAISGGGDVTAAGGGSAPVLVDLDDISGSAGYSVPVDVYNKIANASSAKTPIFGYSKLVSGSIATYEIVPLYVKNVSNTAGTNGGLSIQFIVENAHNNVGITKLSDGKCFISISSSHPFALST